MKTTASKNKEAQMAKRGLTRTGKRKKVFVNKI